MKIYSIKEAYLTLQGEGGQAGRAAVFCRFAGCNLWTGREEDRHHAICQFCDTDFFGTDGENGGKYTVDQLIDLIVGLWPKTKSGEPMVVCTGGEPLLQLDAALIEALHQLNFAIAVETNGTIKVPEGINWVCVSPKAGAHLKQLKGNELKLVYPQTGLDPADFADLAFDHFYIQPMDGPAVSENIQKSISFCLQNPQWRLSLQTHKLVGLK
ncbi:MAG: 7-carboxy-7-deazaguanine synthase [Saprospiraceae bacterium]|nr:7-carboxy-7-deazaguanine synthase [Saprospiraceae bacterium]